MQKRSMSSTSANFKLFAVAGGLSKGPIGGGIGLFFAKALRKEGVEVKMLTRASSIESPAVHELAALGIPIVEVDYDSPSSLASALSGVDVVISGLAGGGFAAQIPLAQAAKEAGVKLFVPSEFGPCLPPNVPEDSPIYSRIKLAQDIKEVGVSVLRVSCGHFADWISGSLCVSDKNEIVIIGEGKTDISFTSRPDLAEFVAHVLTHLDPSLLTTLSTLPIEGSKACFLNLSRILIAQNPSVKVVHESHETALKRFEEEGDFMAFLKVSWDLGGLRSAERDEDLKNGLWPEWKPRRVEEFLEEGREKVEIEFGLSDVTGEGK
ncbi:hypothetical protein BDY24DRAFT_387670 [Mrakia frigida]|uniref:uncharacterized protein n=1 Tax=Mrakia frigida TaxID=29902 RepID=UPI003FCC0EE5